MTDEQRLEQIRRYHCNSTEWATEYDDVGWLLSQLDAARQQIQEHDLSFDLRWKADMRAIERWRGDDPSKELRMPDHADLCVWLLEQLDAAHQDVETKAHHYRMQAQLNEELDKQLTASEQREKRLREALELIAKEWRQNNERSR